MIIGFSKEADTKETRVAISPDTASKFKQSGFKVLILSGSGLASGFSDEKYQQSGADIISQSDKISSQADILLKISAPSLQEINLLKKESFIIGDMSNISSKAKQQLLHKSVFCFGLERLPRTSSAQIFDILSSQNNLSGYQAVIKALSFSPRIVPLMITSAGTLPPLKFLIIGGGVAGLQAAATAKRLGAKVYITDTRPEVKEQATSLGALFVSDIVEILPQINIIISSAFSPDKKAPLIVNRSMLKLLPSGSIIIDMAASKGGNIEGSKQGCVVSLLSHTIYGDSFLAREIPGSSSPLLANNLCNFTMKLYSAAKKSLLPDFSDELISSTCITKG